MKIIDDIKSARPDLRVVVGGEHVTAMPEFCLMTSKADYVVQGEGEETIIELLQAIEDGAPVDDIAGLGFRDADESGSSCVVLPRRSRREDVDKINPPAWHHIDLETYHENQFVGGMCVDTLTIPILATRGCPYQCTYCSSPNMWLPRWIPRDTIGVVNEI